MSHRVARLAELAERRPPQVGHSRFALGLDQVESGSGRLVERWTSEVPREGTKFSKGDVLFGKLRPYLAKAWVSDEPGVYVGDFICLRPSRATDPRFLSYLLRSREFIDRCTAEAHGSKMPRVEWSRVKSFPVPAPSPAEQRSIADYLDHETAEIDAFIVDLQRMSGLEDERRGAVIDWIAAGGDPEVSTTKGALKRWLWRVDQGVSPEAEAREIGDQETGVLKAGCVNRGVFNEREHKALPVDYSVDERLLVRAGDVLVNRASGSPELVGSGAMVRQVARRLMLSDKIFRLVPTALLRPEYLELLLNSRNVRHQILSSISGAEGLANNIPLSKLRNIEVTVPAIEEQDRRVALARVKLAEIADSKEETHRAIELAKERRRALISAAVTGQLDVKSRRDSVAERIEDESREMR